MKKHRKDSAITRQLLLEAGYMVFCEKGFYNATIADICSLAGTNLASVNYHFGDKETLYREAWLNAFNVSFERFPVDGGVKEDEAPGIRLAGYIKSLINRIMSEPNDLSIMHKEMANPTGLIGDLIAEKISIQFDYGKNIVRELLGEKATDNDVLFCHSSILGQCLHLGASRKKRPKEIAPPDMIQDIEKYSQHVIDFSLAGIYARRKQIY